MSKPLHKRAILEENHTLANLAFGAWCCRGSRCECWSPPRGKASTGLIRRHVVARTPREVRLELGAAKAAQCRTEKEPCAASGDMLRRGPKTRGAGTARGSLRRGLRERCGRPGCAPAPQPRLGPLRLTVKVSATTSSWSTDASSALLSASKSRKEISSTSSEKAHISPSKMVFALRESVLGGNFLRLQVCSPQ